MFDRKGAHSFWIATAALLICSVWTSPASAQDRFDIQNLNPMPSQTTNYIGVSSAHVLEEFQWEVGLFLLYTDDPLVLMKNDERAYSIVSGQFSGNLMGAIGFGDIFDIGLDIPIVFFQSGDDLPQSTGLNASDAGFGIGDIRLVPKILAYTMETKDDPSGLSLAFLINGYLPTGNDDYFQGEGFRIEPRVAVDWAFSQGTRIGANLGYNIREEAVAENVQVNDTFTWGVAADIVFDEQKTIHIVPELFGEVSVLADDLTSEEVPFEMLLAVRYFPIDELMIQGGGGMGLVNGFGTPDFRVFLGVGYKEIPDPDRDKDGILNDDDQCPDNPEDFDQFEDENGCPDPDNDKDGILDVNDQCPLDPEDKDDFEDEDGCPDPDNDKDGILDEDDACPNDPEDMDDFEDVNGCPDPDNDEDGVLDVDDQCPLIPEDLDKFEDEDGCPDPDNDKDGLVDVKDGCPDVPEDYDGFEDEDGCPEEGSGLVVLTCEQIEIKDKVHFETASDVIKEKSFEMLNQIATILNAATHIKLVRIEGHTDSRGGDDYNMDLSQRRANSVRKYLIEQGVDPSRLKAVGFGETDPIDDNKTKKGRANNRRVEFHVEEQETECVDEQ